MEKIKEILFTFACVTTMVLIGSATYITIFWKDAVLDYNILWQLIFTDILCSVDNVLYPKECKSKKQLYILIGIHYLYINVIVLGAGFFFEWFSPDNLYMICSLVFMIAVIFLTVSLLLQYYYKKKAEVMNERLQEYIKKKNK